MNLEGKSILVDIKRLDLKIEKRKERMDELGALGKIERCTRTGF